MEEEIEKEETDTSKEELFEDENEKQKGKMENEDTEIKDISHESQEIKSPESSPEKKNLPESHKRSESSPEKKNLPEPHKSPESSPEKKILESPKSLEKKNLPESPKSPESTVDKELEEDQGHHQGHPSEDIPSTPPESNPKTTEIILYPPSHELQSSNPKRALTLYPETSRTLSQKKEEKLFAERKHRTNITCTFIIIVILLCLLTISYLIGGTWLFLYLEETQEVAYIKEFERLKNDTAILLATELRQVKAHEAIWSQYVFKHLDIYEDALLKSTGLGYWRRDHDDGKQRWTYPNTVFYSLSLMTSTGYGSMTPRSKWGRTATVCYSIFGIPLMLSWIVCMGHLFAYYWSWMFDSVCCRFLGFGPDEDVSTTPRHQGNRKFHFRSNSVAPAPETNNSVLTNNPNETQDKSLELERTTENKFHYHLKNDVKRAYDTLQHSDTSSGIEEAIVKRNYALIDRKLNDLDHAVSIVFAMIFFIAYFVFGSVMFSLIEDLAITDILYFNYLMLVSIGPGCYELQDDIAENKIKGNLAYIIYLIFGYIMLSMVLNLIYMYFYPSSRRYRSHRRVKS
ncbi:ion_trans_2 domain-containing protein [Caerostris darwini]|uniref:Ion_trans_2 domain-containing protein n=1 Tax=Caerostris darwini TaxID=1538125 RepID=A0AAV4X5T5_9ARAC|nr:ion_trans_2 domain-containing protein [Caerostris darwini]